MILRVQASVDLDCNELSICLPPALNHGRASIAIIVGNYEDGLASSATDATGIDRIRNITPSVN